MRIVVALFIALAVTTPAAAEACVEKFRRILVDRNETGPVKVTVTQQVKGAPATRNINYQAGPGHWMTEMIEPANGQWTLVHDDVMFTSTDKGATWKKLRALDSANNADQSRRNMEEAAATVKDAACGMEAIDGVAHDTVEASYEIPAYKTAHRDKYWIEPSSGWIARSISMMKMSGFESTVTQVIERAPGLELPTPSR